MKFYSQAFDVFLNYSETQVFSLSVFNIIYDETWRTPLRYYDAYTRYDRASTEPRIYLGFPLYILVFQRDLFLIKLHLKIPNS